ncbi:hypothetical protein CEUSTIGMA_g2751.t1 [Chlamydomonas eustigma]|uniref:Agenet-like domain-containing protein n=1 Tax=Chlamydomonas eustigma TaxID=1157962 RepID=A0A250WX00_9CHLO|nr:hypothetical protein CEUSTIGMA_g2751.t1 [Chlamydomonas eustigma]|eukprot:GAX75306.1 hypothetical protein CEUSTIGMA_g2751.t1 [Chlamydomonas eustigma]
MAEKVRVWWVPTDDNEKEGYAGAYWPAKVISKTKNKYLVQYDNGEREEVHCDHISEYVLPVGFGDESQALLPGEFCEVHNGSKSDPCAWFGRVVKSGGKGGTYLVEYPFHDSEPEQIEKKKIRRARVMEDGEWRLVKPHQHWEAREVTSPCELELINEEDLDMYIKDVVVEEVESVPIAGGGGGKRKAKKEVPAEVELSAPEGKVGRRRREESEPAVKIPPLPFSFGEELTDIQGGEFCQVLRPGQKEAIFAYVLKQNKDRTLKVKFPFEEDSQTEIVKLLAIDESFNSFRSIIRSQSVVFMQFMQRMAIEFDDVRRARMFEKGEWKLFRPFQQWDPGEVLSPEELDLIPENDLLAYLPDNPEDIKNGVFKVSGKYNGKRGRPKKRAQREDDDEEFGRSSQEEQDDLYDKNKRTPARMVPITQRRPGVLVTAGPSSSLHHETNINATVAERQAGSYCPPTLNPEIKVEEGAAAAEGYVTQSGYLSGCSGDLRPEQGGGSGRTASKSLKENANLAAAAAAASYMRPSLIATELHPPPGMARLFVHIESQHYSQPTMAGTAGGCVLVPVREGDSTSGAVQVLVPQSLLPRLRLSAQSDASQPA